MRLVVIVSIFNVCIFLFFAVLIFSAFTTLGIQYMRVFWYDNWYLLLICAVIIVVLNIFFWKNKKLLTALEAENWLLAIHLLRERICKKKYLWYNTLRLFVHVCVIAGKMEVLHSVEETAASKHRKALRKSLLSFAVSYLIRADFDGLIQFYKRYEHLAKGRQQEWLVCLYAISLLSKNSVDEASELLFSLGKELKAGVLLALTAYLLHTICSNKKRDDGVLYEFVRKSQTLVGIRFQKRHWEKKIRNNVLHFLALRSLLHKVGIWIYGDNNDEKA